MELRQIEKAARFWALGKGTAEIANRLDIPEHRIYNKIEVIKHPELIGQLNLSLAGRAR